MTIEEYYSLDGKDLNDCLAAESQATGVPVNVLKTLYLIRNIPQHVIPYIAEDLGLSMQQSGGTETQSVGANDAQTV